MMVTVYLFGAARDLAHAEQLVVPGCATVAALRTAIVAACPALSGLVTRSQIAVNLQAEPDASLIPAGAELALIPPVSGG